MTFVINTRDKTTESKYNTEYLLTDQTKIGRLYRIISYMVVHNQSERRGPESTRPYW